MSLTSLLSHNSQLKELFATIPNLKNEFRAWDGSAAFPSQLQCQVKRATRATPIIGHAYDYFLRAFVQRLNGIHQEASREHLTAHIAVDYLGNKRIHEAFKLILERRNAFIRGKRDLDTTLLQDCLIIGNLDHLYRSGLGHEYNMLITPAEDLYDLEKLAKATELHTQLFIARDNLLCNPAFGKAVTTLVDGADGDLILDGMLIDIKCESAFKWQIRHSRQLIAYWMLSCLSPSFTTEIRRLAIWNPRYCRLVYIDIEDICRAVNMVEFVTRFISIISSPSYDESNHLSPAVRNRFVEEIRQIWASADNPIKSYYK